MPWIDLPGDSQIEPILRMHALMYHGMLCTQFSRGRNTVITFSPAQTCHTNNLLTNSFPPDQSDHDHHMLRRLSALFCWTVQCKQCPIFQ